MASLTQEFGIVTSVLTIGGTTFCSSEVSITTAADGFQYTCTASEIQNALVSGIYQWGGTATLAYDNDGEIDSLRGFTGAFSHVITTTNGQLITQSGNIVVTAVDAGPFSFGELPSASISFIGNGDFSEVASTI